MEPPTFAFLWDRAQEDNSDAIRSAIDYILPTYLDPNGIFAKLAEIAIINNHISVLEVLLTRKKYVRDTRCRFGSSNITLLELASICGYTKSIQFILQSLRGARAHYSAKVGRIELTKISLHILGRKLGPKFADKFMRPSGRIVSQ
jgi:hypothetical protein